MTSGIHEKRCLKKNDNNMIMSDFLKTEILHEKFRFLEYIKETARKKN